MSASVPQALSVDLLIYQNKQLSRLVRSLRLSVRSCNSQVAGINVEDDSTCELERLRCRIRQLESRIERRSPENHTRRSGHTQNSDSYIPPSCVDNIAHAPADERCAKCEDYIRISTSLAIANSRLKEMEEIRSEDRDELTKTPAVSNLLIAKLSEWDQILSGLRQQTALRFLEYERLYGQQSQFILSERDKLRSLHENASLVSAGISEQAVKIESMGATAPIQDPHNDIDGTLSASSQKLREALRSKEEQLSRILVQLVHQQTICNETEKELDQTRTQLEMGASLKSNALNQKDNLARLYGKIDERISSLSNEISTRTYMLNICVQELHRCAAHLAEAEACNVNLNNVTANLRTQVEEATRELVHAKRIRFSASSGQISSSLVNMEIEDIKQKIRCTLCGLRDKSVTLATCMHCFCRECVNQQMLAARNRKCPLCAQRFADADVREVHFLQS